MRAPRTSGAVHEAMTLAAVWNLPVIFFCENTYPTALALVASGQIDPKPLVTHRFPLERVADAFATVQNPASHAVKVIVEIA